MDVKAPDEDRYRFGPFLLDLGTRSLTRGEEPVALTHRLFELLLAFVRSPGRLLTKDELMEAVWPGRYIEEGSLTQAIFTLRKALNEPERDASYVVTVPGRGYTFMARVEKISPALGPPAAAMLSPAEAATLTTVPIATIWMRPQFLLPFALGVAACVALTVLLVGRFSHEPVQLSALAPNVIVAAEFENFTGEAVFQNVLERVLAIDLSQSPFLQILSQQQIGDTLALMAQPAAGSLSADLARKVCLRNGGGAVVGGTVSKLDADYLLTVTATDCISGRMLENEKAEARGKVALIQSLDGLASKLRAKLGETASSIQKFDVPLLNEKTASFDALVAFSRGVSLYDQGKRVEGVALFKHAIALDPNFAIAYAHLSGADYALDEDDEAAQAIAKAYALRGTVNERERLMMEARYHENVQRDIVQTISDYKLWTEMYPRDAIAWADLANSEDFVGRHSDAVAAGERAVALDPKEEAPFVILMRAYMRSGRIADALAVSRTIVSRHLDGDDTHRDLLEIAYLRHDARGMAAQIAWAKGKTAEQRLLLMTQGLIVYSQGRIAAGDALFAQSATLGRQLGLHDPTTATRANLLAAFGLTPRAQALLAQIPGHMGLGDYLLTTAEIGDETLAKSILSTALNRSPADTILYNYSAPVVRAALDLRDGQPQAALADLRPAIPYERRGYDVPYLRGAASLALKDGALAVNEYRFITDNPGINPISTLHTLAFLGLARAYKIEGHLADSRRAYETFLAILSNADPGLPVRAQAQAELAALSAPQRLHQVSDHHGA
jgi:DNA-binding winged helix-turn-helix (wHTH) protein